jgi:hypothetical protein
MRPNNIAPKGRRRLLKTFALVAATMLGFVVFACVYWSKQDVRPVAGTEPSGKNTPERADAVRLATQPHRADPSLSLESRLIELEKAQERKAVEQRAAEAEPEPTVEEARALFEERIATSRREPVDSRWAGSTSQLIREDLENAFAGSSGRLVEVDCRKTTCSATFEWPSSEEAASQYSSLFFARPLRANCGVSILVPQEAGTQAGPIRTTALFECASWREAGSQPLEAVRSGAIAENN